MVGVDSFVLCSIFIIIQHVQAVCPGDWIGPECKQNMHLDKIFLPPHYNLSWGHGQNLALFHKKLKEKRSLLHALQRNQIPLPSSKDCLGYGKARINPVPYTETSQSGHSDTYLPALDSSRCQGATFDEAELYSFCNRSTSRALKIVDYGYGSEIHYVMKALGEGLRDGYSIYPTGKLNLAETQDYCNNNHLCYFEPYYWTGCSNGSASSQPQKKVIVPTNPVEVAPWVVPAAYSSLGVFEYRAMLVAFLHRPNQAMRQLVRVASAKMRGWDFDVPCIGMHIRRGDSCNDKEAKRECYPNERYIEAALHLRRKYDIHCIFVATDDSTAPEALREAFTKIDAANHTNAAGGAWHKMQVFDQQNDRSPYNKCPNGLCEIKGKHVYLENERHLYKGAQGFKLGSEMLVDIELLSSCVAFVGAMSSNNFRLAVELAYARRGLHPPFISLDTSWCWFGFGEFRINGRDAPMAC